MNYLQTDWSRLGSLSSGLVVLQVPMFIEAGISPQIAAGLASVVGVSMIIGRIGTGYLLDVFHASKVLMWFRRWKEKGIAKLN